MVFDRCLDQLGAGSQRSLRMKSLVSAAHAIAQAIEDDGVARMGLGREPAYHNRLHMADTLVCMTHLLLAQRLVSADKSADIEVECLALVVMLGHDFLHCGRVNRFPAELESLAVSLLRPILRKQGVLQGDEDVIAHCILKTEPSGVKQSHALIAGRPFDLEDRDCLAVMATEADILASTLQLTGIELTEMLAQEWSTFDPDMGANLLKPASRIYFLEQAALFSSPAAQLLNIDGLKRTQISALKVPAV